MRLICQALCITECVHDGHVGGPKQYNDFPLGNIFYFYANIFYCFSPPTLPRAHTLLDLSFSTRGVSGQFSGRISLYGPINSTSLLSSAPV